MFKEFFVTVDLKMIIRSNSFVVNTNDLDSLKLSFTVKDNGKPVDISGAEIRIAIQKPDRKAVLQDCEITNGPEGKCTVVLTNQAYLLPGEHKAELMIFNKSENVITTHPFRYNSTKGIMDSKTVESTNEYPALMKVLEIGDRFKDVDPSVFDDVKDLATKAELEPLATKTELKPIEDEIKKNAAQLAETATREEVKNNYTKKVKDVNGGQFLAPVRVPTLGVEQTFPNKKNPYFPVWVDNKTIYAYGLDNTLRKSLDGGRTWEKRGYNAYGFGAYDCFMKTNTGILLNIESVTKSIQISTDDGATWKFVHTFRTNTIPLGSQSWCIDPVTNYIYMGEYFTASTNDIKIWRSIDNGATWQDFYTFPGELTPTGTANRIRHIHSVQYDPFDKRIVVSTGDSTPSTGLWRTNSTGDTLEKIVTNDMLSVAEMDSPRSIGIMPFPNYIAWAGDTTLNPYLYRIARSEIGKVNPKIEKVYRLNSAAWFTCKASNDGSRWVLSASDEGDSLDEFVHIYCVEDEGATVWEVGAIPTPKASPVSSLQPLGTPNQGENFYMVTRGFGELKTIWKFQLAKGLIPLQMREVLPDVLVPQTFSAGLISLAPTEEKVFGVTMSGGFAKKLYIMEAGVGAVDLGGTVGNLTLIVRKKGETTPIYSTTNFSDRYSTRQDMGSETSAHSLVASQIYEFVIKNTHVGVTVTCAPAVTFGWGIV